MTSFRLRTYSAMMLLGVFLGGLPLGCLRGQDAPAEASPPLTEDSSKVGNRKSEYKASPSLHEIHGTVLDTRQEISKEMFAKLVAMESKGETEKALEEILRPKPMPHVIVTLRGQSIEKQTTTDLKGKFEFSDLPLGDYGLSTSATVRSSITGRERMATAMARAQVRYQNTWPVTLKLHAGFVTVKGRITDIYGRPIPGARVTGTEVVRGPTEADAYRPATYWTVSHVDGSYELQTGVPVELPCFCRYLLGGSLCMGTDGQIDVRVEAPGFAQKKDTKVTLMTEDLLVSACHFIKVLAQYDEAKLPDLESHALPSCKGNTMSGIDVVLHRTETSGG
jgi:hypothetical protein